ncbi:hypothetical protein MO973_10365 [Paenibacillus sp. TRM 82003]|nr:hypothetical protein [Paenibacillus sp. TRM 82003]
MGRNLIAKALLAALALTLFPEGGTASTNADEAVRQANEFLSEKMDLNGYYKLSSDEGQINRELATNGTPAFGGKPVFVYGNRESASAEATTNGRYYADVNGERVYRALGFARNGESFPNPSFTPDNEGYLATDKKWVRQPWGGNGDRQLLRENGAVYTRYMSTAQYGGLDYIGRWVESTSRFTPDLVQAGTGRRDTFAANAVDVPEVLKNGIEDFLHIIQPPTEHAWGLGIAFYYWNGYNRLNYRTFLLKPFDMTASDLSAFFTPHRSGAAEGAEILIGVQIDSTFKSEVSDVPYRWRLRTVSGAEVRAVTYQGSVAAREGRFEGIPPNGERVLYARFTMPSEAVRITFEVNGEGESPQESYLANNRIETTLNLVSAVHSSGEFELDYNVLSRTVTYPLHTSDIAARLSLPYGSWSGPATGSLNVTNGAPTLFRDFRVQNNPPVNEHGTHIVRRPQIETTAYRTDFGDDPVGGQWRNLDNPAAPVSRSGVVEFGGTVTRPYTYSYPVCNGELACWTVTVNDSTSADFNPGTNGRTIHAHVYNGMRRIAPKTFDDKIDSNTPDALRKRLHWASEPYPIRVIRWMYHMNAAGQLVNGVKVNGQYERTFRQQNVGLVAWSAARSMEQEYRQSRDAAKNRNYSSSDYDKAVFASDADVRNVDYPIKSGYYFNPTGEYTFEVETVTYKPTSADTKDHRDLVDAVAKSFRYESDLVYINQYKEAVNLQNERLASRGSGYERKAASLTAEDPTGVDGAVLLQVLGRNEDGSRYMKTVEALPHAESDAGTTHPFLKEIMEGYGESGTAGSKTNYKYTEYVKAGQTMYKITEKTVVTIRVNPEGRNVYTHAQMADGTYTARAWIGDIALANIDNEYKKLGVLRGVTALDQIQITVKGSLYDDTNS